MKSRLFFLISLNLCCSVFGMDDEDDIYTASRSTMYCIYSAPVLTQKNVYPIRIYQQLSKLTERKPFCGTRDQYQRLLARIKMGNKIPVLGRFCIYTAANKDKKWENYWECWHAIEREQIAIALLRMRNPLRLNDSVFRYDQWLIPQEKKAFCAQMMEQLAYFFSDKESELHEGPYVTKEWGKMDADGSRILKEIKHELVVFKSTDFDLKDIKKCWSHEETRSILKENVHDTTSPIIPLTTFAYGQSNAACIEQDEVLDEDVYDVEAVPIRQELKKSTGSKVYKLS